MEGVQVCPAVATAYRAMDAAAGRSGQPEVVPFGVLADASKIDYYHGLGCTEVVLRVDGADRDATLRQLDQLELLLAR